jgi:hypothetical protein
MLMAVDIITEAIIDRPHAEVAAYAGNPDHVPGERLVMRTAEGPFPMETTYTWTAASERSTRMTLRNRGEPRGFGKVATPLMAAAMRRANRKDLARLKEILEGRAADG